MGYARYFQKTPHVGDDDFVPGVTFDRIRAIYDADEELRDALSRRLGQAETLLRSHTAYVIAHAYGPYGRYLHRDFYTDMPNAEPTADALLRDVRRSKERHILRFTAGSGLQPFAQLPVWSAVEAWSFGSLSKCIERGDGGTLANHVADSLGVARAGFAYRVRALVYLRNRCAHHSRLWHHSVVDAGPTPNNVRGRAKKLAGQFQPRSVLDVVASLDDIVVRGARAEPVLPELVARHKEDQELWEGLCAPLSPRDHDA
ncbi:Abi family protein [Cnuibacter physcomitrellae]|uniref:Abi family protein n=1 Tax=Cnuibacter physcomitrellae TaxID=1619308 RepID=UPI002175B131|nr:Abi family protein [Cnuibacter physcomitrellae]MCS5497270.1 Abi family protein [Cnuibacter physcomitrellae]